MDLLRSVTSFRSSRHCSLALVAVAINEQAVYATPSQHQSLERFLEELLHSGGGAGGLPT